METKRQIRARHLKERNALSLEDRSFWSSKISQNLTEYFKRRFKICRINGIYGYYPHGSEVSLTELYDWLLEKEIPLAFPAVKGDTMEFYRVDSMRDFAPGTFGIMEPVFRREVANFKSAFCLVPGSVFDRFGSRYGYGKGYYDRYFSMHEGLFRMGIAYAAQVEREIPSESCDVNMYALATEEAVTEMPALAVWKRELSETGE